MGNIIEQHVLESRQDIFTTYRELHERAEVSWKEFETGKYICGVLKKIGIRHETFPEHTGIVGYWGDASLGPTIGIRADMDALYQMVDGEWKANHSCGHDGHMTMVLHSIMTLKDIGFQPKGLIKIIFQPAEETGYGAKALIEKKVTENMDYLIGIHVRPIQEMNEKEASPAIYHGATSMLIGEVKGNQAHAARPHLGINVIDSLSAITAAVNAIKIDPMVSASAKITMVRAGEHNLNTIPDYAEFAIDVRAQSDELMTWLLQEVEHAVLRAGNVNHAEVSLRTVSRMIAAKSSILIEEIVEECIVEVLGEDGLVSPPVTPGGEDFHYYKSMEPTLEATMIGLGTGLSPGLHHPHMKFNLYSLLDGIQILSRVLLKLSS